MKVRYLYILIFLSSLILFSSCRKSSTSTDYIVVGIAQDVESINPLFAFSVDEGSISELLYLGMVQHDWDEEKGEITSKPLLAKEWTWSQDTSSITISLRDDAEWSDGEKLTAKDVVFSFDIFSDPVVDSRLYGSFENFILTLRAILLQAKPSKYFLITGLRSISFLILTRLYLILIYPFCPNIFSPG